MGLVIRCMYNNNDWKDACFKPGEDPKCELCFYPRVQIRPPNRDDKEKCSGECWERYICTKFRWGCTPQGNTFARAYVGMKVFFVFKQLSGNYTIWGTTKVVSIDREPVRTGKDFEDNFAFIHFEPFKPLPKENWVEGLSAKELVGKEWLQGRFRYIDEEKERYLERLIRGETPEMTQGSTIMTSLSDSMTVLNIPMTVHINKRLDEIAQQEGRGKDEIIREAVAEWLKGREG